MYTAPLDTGFIAGRAVDLDDAAAASGRTPVETLVPGQSADRDRARQPAVQWRQLVRQQRSDWFALLALIELGLLAVAMLVAGWTALALDLAPLALAQTIMFVLVGWVGMVALGLYQRHSEFASGLGIGSASRIGAALLVGAVFALGLAALGGGAGNAPGLGIALGCSAAFLLLSRLGSARMAGHELLRRRTLFLGAGARAAEVVQRLHLDDAGQSARSLKVVGFVPLSSDVVALADVRRLRPGGTLVELARQHEVDEIVIVADDRRRSLPMLDLVACRLAGIKVLHLDDFYEREFGKTALDLIQPSWCVFAQDFDTSALRQTSKRGFDLIVATAILLLGWPLMLLVAAAIRIESRGQGPVLYSQERVGSHGSRFLLYKFRSMRTDAESDGVARWAQAGDSRVTVVGAIIRKFRLDELPQLWNVLKGEMSMVGPRPERPEFVAGLTERIPHYGLRHCVRPGLAGWAQLRFPYGASEADAVEKLRYDLYYVKFQALRFDLLILLQTVEVVLFGRGAR